MMVALCVGCCCLLLFVCVERERGEDGLEHELM